MTDVDTVADLPLIRLYEGDSLDVLATIPEHTYTYFVTDPPYGLSAPANPYDVLAQWLTDGNFARTGGRKKAPPHGVSEIAARLSKTAGPGGMLGMQWDAFVPGPKLWAAVFRVCKPGAIGAVFAAPRTQHWMTLALVLAGFEVIECAGYVTSMGMPKAGTIDKRIDARLGVVRPVIGKHPNPAGNDKDGTNAMGGGWQDAPDLTAPGSDASAEWAGWSTTLAPALEPIIIVRRPCEGTATTNVLKHGCGAFHVDACRVPAAKGDEPLRWSQPRDMGYGRGTDTGPCEALSTEGGRWPKTLLLSPESADVLDELVGERKSGSRAAGVRKGIGYGSNAQGDGGPAIEGSTGGPSRFFSVVDNDRDRWDWTGPLAADEDKALPIKYTSKVSKKERQLGLPEGSKSDHPTMKSCEKRDSIMRWLCRLVGHPQGRGLDPFAGSGSTLRAARHEGLPFDGIERDPHYARDLALPRSGVARLTPWRPEDVAAAASEAFDADAQSTADALSQLRESGGLPQAQIDELMGRADAPPAIEPVARTAAELVEADLEDRCCMLVARGVCEDMTADESAAIIVALRVRAAELGADTIYPNVREVHFECSWDGSAATVKVTRAPFAHPGETGLHRATVDVRIDRPGKAADVAESALEWSELVALLLHRGDVLDAAPERCEHAVRS